MPGSGLKPTTCGLGVRESGSPYLYLFMRPNNFFLFGVFLACCRAELQHRLQRGKFRNSSVFSSGVPCDRLLGYSDVGSNIRLLKVNHS
jgi:hypothetical protein